MPISVKVARSINVGSGISYHTDYLLEISINGKIWSLYRRFSAFEDFHKKLLVEIGPEIPFGVKFPEKIYVGSYFGTLNLVTSDRITALQQYLDAVIIVEDAVDSRSLSDFLDCDHLGLSGMTRELGADRVLKEAFVCTRISKNLPEVLGLWCTRFVVLLSSGSVVVLNSVYDDSVKAITRLALVNGQTTVTPIAAGNVITIASSLDKSKISLSFPTQADSVFWLRKLSDFVLNTEFSADHQKNVDATKQQEAAERARQQQLAAQNQEHIHAQGTGNTTDDLSAMLGI